MKPVSPIYVIAEAGVNHNGSLEMALELVDVAVKAGADAIKFQTFRASRMVTQYAPKADYQNKTTGNQETQLSMLEQLELSEESHYRILEYCEQKGIEFLSTPFDEESLAFLVEKLHIKKIKIASGEITNAKLLLEAARTGLPLILSTGMSSLGDIEAALGILAIGYCMPYDKPSLTAFKQAYNSALGQNILAEKVALLHCTTEYPTPFEEVNLAAMATLAQTFQLPTGYSDHTQGIVISHAAAALGAKIIEKHFTLNRNLPGPDHQASLEPDELKAMIKGIREVERAIGSVKKIPTATEQKNQIAARKSLVAACKICKGEKFDQYNLGVKRPGNGSSALLYWDYMGKQASKDYEQDECILE